uniref:Putative tail protein n=1 Tax=viral metagenome TaxID=1070528 RepID=A0A6H2A0I6_9ZZZZ
MSYYPQFFPALFERDTAFAAKAVSVAADRYTLLTPEKMAVDVGGKVLPLPAQQEIDLSQAASWDDITGTDWTVAANRAGKDFYIYACNDSGSLVLLLSANSTVPAGYDADTSRKIGGFHCLCVAAGTISGHALTGYLAGDILPASVWDLKHRPICSPEGMVYSEAAQIWVDIYLQSGTGASCASVFGGTITDSRTWLDFVDDLGAVGKRLLEDDEFQLIAAKSNEETNITGSADPVTTGGHVDTAGRRMISDIGCEDCAGALWQWLRTQSYRFDGAANHTHQVTVSGDPETVATGNPSGDVAPAWSSYDLPGSKGSFYKQGTYGDAKLRAGGDWGYGSTCGSRARYAALYRWAATSSLGARGCCARSQGN